jgi:hypothetical protein
MICRQSSGCGSFDLSGLVSPGRTYAASDPAAPVKPDEERPTTAPPRESPHYPSHTPPSPDTKPYSPCPGTENPDEDYPACRTPGVIS